MIRMTRVHLINWHNFSDNIIDFKDITYIIGLNAVGKTTIMDAIRYCLTTNKDFNTAGNKKSARSLQGSVHQKQRAEEVYLRPNHTVTYIGIEFLDESIQKKFVISVRVESENPKQELRHISQDWYISKVGCSLEDMPYFIKVGNNKRPSSKEEFKLPDRGLDKAPSQAEARRRICRVLGIGDAESQLGKKFNEVFHMGTSLEDIDDIRKFIYTYILSEPEIDVDVLHKDMYELEKLQGILEDAQIKEQLLREVMEKLVVAKDLNSKVKINEALVAYAKVQNAKEKRNDKLNEIQEAELIIDKCKSRIIELEYQRQDADKKRIEAMREKENNADSKALDFFTEQLDKNKKEYDKITHMLQKFESAYEDLQKLLSKIKNIGLKFNLDLTVLIDYKVDSAERMKVIKKCKEILLPMGEDIKEGESIVRNRKRELSNEIKELNSKITTLESGKMYYPHEAELVRDRINNRLQEYGKERSAKIFCELLYMSDSEWQNTVESYLNNQRFNIIVEPRYYSIAKSVFVELRDLVKGIGLVDTVRLEEDMKYNHREYGDKKMLSQTIESKNTYAKMYVDYLLGGIVCCDNEDELEQYKRSVTKDGLRYQNYCLQRMRLQERYIGMDALQEQLNNARIELREKRQQENTCSKEINSYVELDKIYQQFLVGGKMQDLEDNYMAKIDSEKLYVRMEEISCKIEEFKKSPLLQAMFNRINEYQKNFDSILDEITTVKSKQANAENLIANGELICDSLQKNIEEAQQEYEEITLTHAQFIDIVIKKYNEERKQKEPTSIIYNFGNRVSQDNKALDRYVNAELLPIQRQFSSTYACDYPEGIEGEAQYQIAYSSLVNIDLEHYSATLNNAKIRCKERFRKEILFRMKDAILSAKQQFNQLNKVMEELTYGEESYHFHISGSRDKELNIFYNIIMDKNNQQIDKDNEIMALLATNQSEVFESQIEEFMQRIMVDIENHEQENLTGKKNGAKTLSTYVDYRTYLDYDIIVKNSITGLKVPLSEVSGDGSGGENQAPFYVAICASFLRIYEQSKNCIRLVLLDEAFNKMTSDRIEPMMKMFNDLKLQVVLISTVEKCTSIFPYCDITYSIVKHGIENAITPFEVV